MIVEPTVDNALGVRTEVEYYGSIASQIRRWRLYLMRDLRIGISKSEPNTSLPR